MGSSFAFLGDEHVGGIVSGKLSEAGFAPARRLSEADYIFTYCITQSQLEDAYMGTGGAIEGAGEGSCLVDLSPSTQMLAKEVYAVARVNELQALDAPLVLKDPCSHDAFGDSGNVMMLVGGEDAAFEDALPLLGQLAGDVRHIGLPGMGQLSKALCTIQQASSLVALVEAWAMAKAQGEEAEGAVSAALEAGLLPRASRGIYRAIADGHFHGTHTCRVLMAELTAVMNAADDADLVLPQAEACQHLLELFLVLGGSDMPAPALALVYADEEECAPYGLSWERAEGLYGRDSHASRGEDPPDGPDYGYDEEEDGYAGGFGGFSSN